LFLLLILFKNQIFFSKEAIRHKEIAGMEAQIYRLIDLLSEQRAATLENVRRKQAKAGEDDEDDENAGGGDISDDDSDPEEDGLIYNPKNLPLGWDGKVTKKKFNLKKNSFFVFIFLANSLLAL